MMDRGEIANAFAATLDPNSRAEAEAKLQECYKIAGFLPAILDIIAAAPEGNMIGVQQAAAVYLKNSVVSHWPPVTEDMLQSTPVLAESHFSFHDEDKNVVRRRLMELIVASPEMIRVQLCVVLNHLIRHDYPAYMADFPELIHQLLQSGDAMKYNGGLMGLYQLVKVYEYKTREERAPIKQPMSVILPVLISRLGAIMGGSSSADTLHLVKMSIKILYGYCQYTLDEEVFTRDLMMQAHMQMVQVVNLPVSEAVMTEGSDGDSNIEWKVKKWALRLMGRIFERYGSLGTVGKEYRSFAEWYIGDVAQQCLVSVCGILEKYGQKCYVSRPAMQNAIKFITTATGQAACWRLLKPNFQPLVENVIFPLMSHDDESQELWDSDPIEFIQCKYDIMEELLSPQDAAKSLLDAACGKRKEVLPKCMAFVMEQLHADDPRRVDGALHILGSLSKVLYGKKQYRNEMERMFMKYIFPHFNSSFPFLRARCCWIFRQFERLRFKDEQNYGNALNFLRFSLSQGGENDLPVKFEAALALLAHASSQQIAKLYLRPHVENVIADLLELVSTTENDELVSAVQCFVSEFPDEIQSKAVEITQKLSNTFLQLIEGEESDEANEKTIVAMGVLNCLENVLQIMSDNREIMVHLERICLNIVVNVLKNHNDDFYEEVFSIVEELTSVHISDVMWEVFYFMCNMYALEDNSPLKVQQADADVTAYDFFTDMMPAFHNYCTVDPAAFMANTDRLEKLFSICRNVLTKPPLDLGEDAECHAAKLLEVLLLQHKHQVEHLMAPFVQLAVDRLNKPITTSELRVMLIEVRDSLKSSQIIVAALYIDTPKCLAILSTVQPEFGEQFIPKFTAQWLSDCDCFFGIHDRKLFVLGICSLLSQPHDVRLAAFSPETLSLLLPNLVLIFNGLKKAYQTRHENEKAAEESDEEEEEVDERLVRELADDDNDEEEGGFGDMNGDEEDDDDDSDYIDDDYDETELEVYETIIDREENCIDEFVIFADTLRRLHEEDRTFYDLLCGAIPQEKNAELEAIIKTAEDRRKIVVTKQLQNSGGFNFTNSTEVPSSFDFSSPGGGSGNK